MPLPQLQCRSAGRRDRWKLQICSGNLVGGCKPLMVRNLDVSFIPFLQTNQHNGRNPQRRRLVDQNQV